MYPNLFASLTKSVLPRVYPSQRLAIDVHLDTAIRLLNRLIEIHVALLLSSMNSPSKVYFLCDTYGFTHFVLHDFTLSLLNSYAAFNGFATSILQHIARTQPSEKDFVSLDCFTKTFQTHWMLWQIIHYELMLSNSCVVLVPSSLDRTAIDDHFERSSGWWYHLFSVFWSRHNCLPDINCDSSICSRVIITDGHQKTRRLVCRFNELIDNTIVEMGPMQTGCPLTPLRRTKNSPEGNRPEKSQQET